jgi:hypothetical protein
MLSDSEESEDLCPLCMEELDITDRHFKPCPCGYQVCILSLQNYIFNILVLSLSLSHFTFIKLHIYMLDVSILLAQIN